MSSTFSEILNLLEIILFYKFIVLDFKILHFLKFFCNVFDLDFIVCNSLKVMYTFFMERKHKLTSKLLSPWNFLH